MIGCELDQLHAKQRGRRPDRSRSTPRARSDRPARRARGASGAAVDRSVTDSVKRAFRRHLLHGGPPARQRCGRVRSDGAAPPDRSRRGKRSTSSTPRKSRRSDSLYATAASRPSCIASQTSCCAAVSGKGVTGAFVSCPPRRREGASRWQEVGAAHLRQAVFERGGRETRGPVRCARVVITNARFSKMWMPRFAQQVEQQAAELLIVRRTELNQRAELRQAGTARRTARAGPRSSVAICVVAAR